MAAGWHVKGVCVRAVGLIPSRLNSTRLPSKALLPIDGLPLVVHTLKRALLAKSLADVYVCTDSIEIANAVEAHGGKFMMTKSSHTNGTERIAEAAQMLDADYFVDIQGDEPLIDPRHIDLVVNEHMQHPTWDILLPSLPISHPESLHVVKVVHDTEMRVIYLSRSVIPQPFRHRPPFYLKHLSIISFRPDALQKFAELPPGNLEIIEGVELLRAIENGMVIGTTLLDGSSFSVDVEEDYARVKVQMLQDEVRKLY
jgi:3-deoxy-manno-octulosonate cytidylyltransferase (CMP-KDO synthetase)